MSSSAETTAAPGEALTFWRWLRDFGRYVRPSGLVNYVLCFAMMMATVAVSTIMIDWLYPDITPSPPEYEGQRMADSMFPPLLAGFFALVTGFIAIPGNWREAVVVSIMAMLSGLLFLIGIIGTFAVQRYLVGVWGANPLILFFAALVAGMLPAFACVLGTAWFFRSPTPAVRPRSQPQPTNSLQEIAIVVVVFAAAVAAVIGFGSFDNWVAPDNCVFPFGAGSLGFLAVYLSWQELLPVWRRAGPLRGAMLRQWGLGMLILLAAVPLGHLFGCDAVPHSMAGKGSRDSLFALFGGYALVVYLAAGMLAAWRMDRFLARHGLRRQDRVAGEEAEA